MWECRGCGKTFEEPKIKRTTQAVLFGLPSLNDPVINLPVCPYCENDEIREEE